MNDRRYLITVQRLDADTEKWQDYMTVHAYINSVSGSEYWSAAAVQAENTVKFDVRYCKKLAELTPDTCRIKWNGHTYDVQHIDDVQYKHQSLIFKAVMLSGR